MTRVTRCWRVGGNSIRPPLERLGPIQTNFSSVPFNQPLRHPSFQRTFIPKHYTMHTNTHSHSNQAPVQTLTFRVFSSMRTASERFVIRVVQRHAPRIRRPRKLARSFRSLRHRRWRCRFTNKTPARPHTNTQYTHKSTALDTRLQHSTSRLVDFARTPRSDTFPVSCAWLLRSYALFRQRVLSRARPEKQIPRYSSDGIRFANLSWTKFWSSNANYCQP